VLVLGIETSSPIGSVALVEDGRLLAEASHDTPNSHGERLLGLIEELFVRTGRERRDLDRIAVGRGPGAFTGLRIGLSLAQGIAQGLSIPAVGIGSLRALALGGSSTLPSVRVALLDARRGELFLACYRDNGEELVAPCTISRGALGTWLLERDAALDDRIDPERERIAVLGAVARGLTSAELDRSRLPPERFTFAVDPLTDYPSARAVASMACNSKSLGPATPDYLRDADAIKPALPPCPLDLPRP
jgi:tRNA threonylcarbamoyl adenosine modification protein YeaZ